MVPVNIYWLRISSGVPPQGSPFSVTLGLQKRQLSPLGEGVKEKRGLATGREGAVVVRALPWGTHTSRIFIGWFWISKILFWSFFGTCSFHGSKTQINGGFKEYSTVGTVPVSIKEIKHEENFYTSRGRIASNPPKRVPNWYLALKTSFFLFPEPHKDSPESVSSGVGNVLYCGRQWKNLNVMIVTRKKNHSGTSQFS
jgi:hypothetical protein